MRHRTIVLGTVFLAAATGLAGCRARKEPPPPPPPPRVTVIHPATADVRDYWVYNGYLDTTKSVEVKSKIRGYLTHVKFVEGTEVTVGTPLYTIDKLEYETAVKRAAAELLKSEAQIKSWDAQIIQSRSDLERVNKAVRGGAESKFKEDEAQATLDVRLAELEAAKATRDAADAALNTAKIQLGYTDIKAKISGRLGRTLVDEGNLVLADTTMLTTIVAVDKLFVYFDAPEADYIAYQRALRKSSVPESSQQIALELGVGDDDGFPYAGVIDFRDNRVETATGTIRIRGRVDNPLKENNVRLLFPGMYARIRVPKSEPVPQTVIPEDCLVSGQEGRFLYVVKPNGIVEKRLVTVGASVWKAQPPRPGEFEPSWAADNPNPPPKEEGKPPAPTHRSIKSMVAITAGLKAEDRVILEGLQQAKPDAAVTPEEWVLKAPVPVAAKK